MELSPSEENYLETIYLVKQDKKAVKPIEIARRMNVKKPSVTGAVKKLSEKGFLEYKRYNNIIITQKGEKAAKDVYSKHKLLVKFFVEILNLDKKIAEEDACKVEHSLSKTALSKLTKFIQELK